MVPELPDESFATLFERDANTPTRRKRPHPGDEVDAVVVQIGKDAVFVEFDGRLQGSIDTAELRTPDGVLAANVGAAIRARVVNVTRDGEIRLVPTLASAAALGLGVALGDGTDATSVRVAVGQAVEGTVSRVETYGVFVQLDGTTDRAGRGLLPAVELGLPRGADLRKTYLVGSKIRAKLIELSETGNMRLSLRALREDEERAQFDGFRSGAETAAPATLATLGDVLKRFQSKR
jgi:small subunit ribosomal protein S1